MTHRIVRIAAPALILALLPLTAAAAGLTPGMYEYTMKTNMPGMPNVPNIPPQVVQHCLTAKDIASKGYGAPSKDSDCRVQDMKESGGQFSYKIACTKPQKMDGTVKGSFTATSMMMDMTMSMGSRGTMTQSTTAKRVGDCK